MKKQFDYYRILPLENFGVFRLQKEKEGKSRLSKNMKYYVWHQNSFCIPYARQRSIEIRLPKRATATSNQKPVDSP